jgi:hypothetical protein
MKGTKRSAVPARAVCEERIVARNAAAFDCDERALRELHRTLDSTLSRRPLLSVADPSQRTRYLSVLREVSLRAWSEVESFESDTGEATGHDLSSPALREAE